MTHHTDLIHLMEREDLPSGTMETVKEKIKLMHTGMLVTTKMDVHQTSTKLSQNRSELFQTMERILHHKITLQVFTLKSSTTTKNITTIVSLKLANGVTLHTGTMETATAPTNSMLGITLAKKHQTLIKPQDNHGSEVQTEMMDQQQIIQWDSLWTKNIRRSISTLLLKRNTTITTRSIITTMTLSNLNNKGQPCFHHLITPDNHIGKHKANNHSGQTEMELVAKRWMHTAI